jgi:hypothetical protein
VEDIYRRVWAALANKQPMKAVYKALPRLFCRHRLVHAAGFLGTNLVEGLVHVGHDMKAVEDMQGLGAFLADKLRMASSPFCRGF